MIENLSKLVVILEWRLWESKLDKDFPMNSTDEGNIEENFMIFYNWRGKKTFLYRRKVPWILFLAKFPNFHWKQKKYSTETLKKINLYAHFLLFIVRYFYKLTFVLNILTFF